MTNPAALALAKHGPNERTLSLAHRLSTQTSPLVTLALVTIRRELDDRAPYVGGGDSSKPRVSGGGRTVWVPEDEHGPGESVPVTSVEAAALAHEHTLATQEEVCDRLDGIIIAVQSFDRFLRTIVGDTGQAVPEVCDGSARGYEGHQLAWVARSGPAGDNGWHDPTCRQIADSTGLCVTCKQRMNRWRTRHGLTPIGVQEAAA